MRATATASFVAVVSQDGNKKVLADPSPRDLDTARSVHVLAFTSHDELLLAESEGDFTVAEWDDVYDTAKRICCQSGATKTGSEMALDDDDGNDGGLDMRQFVRSTVETKVTADLHWK